MKKNFFILITLLLLSTASHSATIEKQRLENTNLDIVIISGNINSGDDQIFENIVKNSSDVIVALDSPGGSVVTGISIGRRIKKSGFSTFVPDNTLCASSCALIWLAGKNRFAEESSFIGFHAAYVYKNGKQVESGVANALVGSYLNELGLSDNAVIFVTNAPPEGIERLDRKKAQLAGIIYSSAKKEENGINDKKRLAVDEKKYDPIATVTKFYQTLSIADGNAASALVIPEKRGIGPFNENNISDFFGSMKEPLKISLVKQIGRNSVEIQYRYRHTNSICNGIAIVETEYFMGNTLIKKIKANC